MRTAKLTTLVFTTVLLAACGDGLGPELSNPDGDSVEASESRQPSSLEVHPTSLVMPVDDSASVEVTVLDQDGKPFETVPEGVEIVWKSSDPAVVSVREGVLASVDLGEATATASADGVGSDDLLARVLPVEYAELTFTHGDRTFTIEGDFGFDRDHPASVFYNRSSWAYTLYWIDKDEQYIIGRSRGEDGDLYGEVYLYVHGRVTEPGTHDHPGWTGYLGLNHELDAGYQEWYDIHDLQMTFQTVTEDRMAGTFSFDLVDGTTVVAEVTDGSFDIPTGADSEGG